MALRLTNAGDYAIRSMIFIASLPEDAVVLRSEICESQRIPSSFMAKILRSLVRAQLLRSTRGVNGGFSLARQPAEITLLHVLEAIEGPEPLVRRRRHDEHEARDQGDQGGEPPRQAGHGRLPRRAARSVLFSRASRSR